MRTRFTLLIALFALSLQAQTPWKDDQFVLSYLTQQAPGTDYISSSTYKKVDLEWVHPYRGLRGPVVTQFVLGISTAAGGEGTGNRVVSVSPYTAVQGEFKPKGLGLKLGWHLSSASDFRFAGGFEIRHESYRFIRHEVGFTADDSSAGFQFWAVGRMEHDFSLGSWQGLAGLRVGLAANQPASLPTSEGGLYVGFRF